MRPINLKKEEFTEKEKRNRDILDILRKYGPISRPDISKEMGINVVTISNYIDDFIKHNLVYEKELDVSEGGRRPTLLDLDAKAGYIVGVGLNLMNMVGILVDLKGNIITKTQRDRPLPSVKEVAEGLLETIREILKRSKQYMKDVRGIGIGIAGLVNKKDGSIRWPQKMDHYYTYASVDLPLQEIIEREFNFPVLIENDATSACFGERWLDLDRSYKNVIYMFSGVGCGIIINGEVYTGMNGYAGEISINNYKEQDLFNCETGRNCFIKRWEADLGIVGDLKTLLAKDKPLQDKFVNLYNAENIEGINLRHVWSAFKAGDKTASAVVESAAKRLGIKIAFLINLFNPQSVIIGGGLEEAGDAFLNSISSTVREWAFRETTEGLRIVYSQLKENSVALGAASLVMQRLFARVL